MKGSLKTVKYLLCYVWKRDKPLLLMLFIEQIIAASLPIVTIVFPKFIIDELMNVQRVTYLAGYIISFGVLSFGINFISKYLWKINFVRIEGRLRFNFDKEISEQIANIEYKYLEMPETLDLKDKAKGSMYQNGQFAGALINLFTVIAQAIALLAISGIIATLHPLMLVVLVLIFFINYQISKRRNKKNYQLTVEKTPFTRKNDYVKNTANDFAYGKEIRLNAINDKLVDSFVDSRDAEMLLNKKSYKNNVNVSTVETITAFAQTVMAYGYLIWQVVFDAMTIGTFSMYFSAIAQFSQVLASVIASFSSLNSVGFTLADLERFMALEKVSDTPQSAATPRDKYVFEFVDISFCYPNSGEYVLKNINIKIDDSQRLSIVGFNGAGKTTFVKLLLRLYKPTFGKILLNGVDINTFDFDEYVQLFSTVFQDFKLFCFTLEENITIGQKSAGVVIDQAIENSGLKTMVDSTPKKTETFIYKIFDETGIEPSGGEGQKIAIARAIYKNAPIIIMDEPTAALDPLAEYEIYRSFDKLVGKKSAIYISHRLSSTRFCDKIAVFRDGEIVEYGAHDALLEQGGLYADMFTKQAQYYFD